MTMAPALPADLVEEMTVALLAATWPAGGRIVDIDEDVLRERVLPLLCEVVHGACCASDSYGPWEHLDDPDDLVSRVCDSCGHEQISPAAELARVHRGGAA